MKKNPHLLTRKIHRYLGVIIGIQFLFWTIGGLYFSWTNIDEIHGDQYIGHNMDHALSSLVLGDSLNSDPEIKQMSLMFVGHKPYLWVNDSYLVDPQTWERKEQISEEEALSVADMHMKPEYKIASAEYIEEVGDHHEYRGKPLPAYVITYEGDENLKAYVGARDGSFQRVRHDSWRVFDFLWMLHTMDYEGRDNFNNWLLRAFSIFGLVTIMSGFMLFYYSSPTIRKMRKGKKKKKKRKS
ncbi:PepSY domain-containing protein [Roseivirga sp. BDSF3-8]|uniref:PepSY domain-containing protein n=1 Tax=Roseivirga sp. BDSF3-8 TaxID=3241598 RepID=UPI0035319996